MGSRGGEEEQEQPSTTIGRPAALLPLLLPRGEPSAPSLPWRGGGGGWSVCLRPRCAQSDREAKATKQQHRGRGKEKSSTLEDCRNRQVKGLESSKNETVLALLPIEPSPFVTPFSGLALSSPFFSRRQQQLGSPKHALQSCSGRPRPRAPRDRRTHRSTRIRLRRRRSSLRALPCE